MAPLVSDRILWVIFLYTGSQMENSGCCRMRTVREQCKYPCSIFERIFLGRLL